MTQDRLRRISRTGLEEFVKCPRCSYLKQAMGLWPPRTPPFTLNLAVDRLLKVEFDRYRSGGEAPPWLAGVLPEVRPFAHPELDAWRDNRRGVIRDWPDAGIRLYGAIDDLWVGADGRVHVVDYKATGSASAVQMDREWHDAYRRQVEVYQWLLRGQGIDVSPTAYFLFCAVDEADEFGGMLRFTPHVVSHEGDDAWVPGTIDAMRRMMESDQMPQPAAACEECQYRRRIRSALLERGWLQ